MSIEAQVLYAGAALGSAAVRIDDDGRAFVAFANPLPVGTTIGLKVGRRVVEGRVERASESAGEAGVGMLIGGVDAELLRAPPEPETEGADVANVSDASARGSSGDVAAGEAPGRAFAKTMFAPGGIPAAELVAAAKAAREAAGKGGGAAAGGATSDAAPVAVAETVTGAIAAAAAAAAGADGGTPTPSPVGVDSDRRGKKKKRR